MFTVVTALISFAVAFVAGGLLSKAYFAVRSAADSEDQRLDEQRQHYRKRIDTLQQIIRRHEDSLEKIKLKLQEFQQRQVRRNKATPPKAKFDELREQLSTRNSEVTQLQRQLESLREEQAAQARRTDGSAEDVSLLRIERDELAARLRRLETEPAESAEASRTRHGDVAGSLRAEMGEMREALAQRDRQVHELQRHLDDRDRQLQDLGERLATWKQRVAPLTAKLRQQRDVIRHYRSQQGNAEDSGAEAAVDDGPCDDLKSIRGIGPALERRLNKKGIRRFEQIAKMSDAEIEQVARQLEIAPNLAQRDRWIEQARDLLEQHSPA
jgi:predicted flap endonuclease-1-like 5' DNA nuclease